MGEKLCNLCDREFDYIQAKDVAEYDRIVVGSYSCFNYFQFLMAKDIDFSKRKFDIVIPTIPQMKLNECCIEKIISLIEKAHSVVVNDYGMLSLMYDRVDSNKIRLGRCFIKDYRDFRYPEYDRSYHKGYIQSQIEILKKLGFEINSIESEIITSDYDLSSLDNINVYYHFPFRMVSMSHICEFAAIGKKIEQKFVPDDLCIAQCLQYSYSGNGLYKYGRGVYDLLSDEYLSQFDDSVNIIYYPR